MAKLPSWADALLYGIRYVYDAIGALLPERSSIQFSGSVDVADDSINKRTVVTVFGTTPDGMGGEVLGSAGGGWVSVKSDGSGFRVDNDDESGFAFSVDNSAASIRFGYQALFSSVLSVADTSAASTPLTGVTIQAVAGRFRVAQHATPSVTGSRGGNAALASALTALAVAGLITDSST